jgi:glycolate oxidase FAD binding subunit
MEVTTVGQATGLMTVAVNGSPDAATDLIKDLRARVAGFDGSMVVLRLPDSLRDNFDVWGLNSGALPLMREIKRRFDPGRTLNPGRFVGGI